HLVERDLQQVWQALAAVFGLASQARPAGGTESLIGPFESMRRLDRMRGDVVRAPLGITRLIDRSQQVLAELAGFLDDLINRLGIKVGVTWQRLQHVDSA